MTAVLSMGLFGAVWALEAFKPALGAVSHKLFYSLEPLCFANGASYVKWDPLHHVELSLVQRCVILFWTVSTAYS